MTNEDFLNRVFTKFRGMSGVSDELADEVRSHAHVVIEASRSKEPTPTGGSKIGGCPDLPTGFDWPKEDEEEDMELAFLCQINLAEVEPHDLANRLPQTGMIWVFTIADGDRAYSYEIDDDTTALFFDANPGELESIDIPESLQEEEESEIDEHRLTFGPSIQLSEINDAGHVDSKRYDYSIEQNLREATASEGGASGVVQLLGNAHFFREENLDQFDPDTDEVLLAIDGYSVASHAFGEGGFSWIISKDALSTGNLQSAFLTFEPGT